MDINTTKQTIMLNETCFEQLVEQSIDTDFTLPDYCPEIVRVLKCRVVPQLNSKNISGGILRVDGTAHITLIYADEQGKICAFEHFYNFEKNINVGVASDDCITDIKILSDYMNCRAVTSRKMDIHGVFSIKIKLVKSKPCEILTDFDACGMQLKRGECPSTNALGSAQKIVVIEEELELSRGNSAIKSILRSEARAVVEDCKIVGNKAIVGGDIIINALYCTDDGNTELYENKVPFNQIIDIDVDGVDCKCDAIVKVLSCVLKPRTNLSGETKGFYFDSKICIVVNATCDNDIPVLLDAYCTKHEVEIDTEDINFKKLDSTLNERYICKKKLEFSQKSFGNIADIWCENKLGQVKIVDKSLSISGTIIICLLTYDIDGVAQYFERSIDFEYSKNIESTNRNLVCDADFETVSCSYTILSEDKLEANVELAINATIYSVKSHRIIKNIEINESKKKCIKKAPLTVYYADKGEELWEISKKFNTECDKVKLINEINDECFNNDTVILIP